MKERTIFEGRRSGKSEYARRMMEKFMDENPDAKVCVASLSGFEFFENAEFEVVTNLLPEPK